MDSSVVSSAPAACCFAVPDALGRLRFRGAFPAGAQAQGLELHAGVAARRGA